jgi:hypothetical protein
MGLIIYKALAFALIFLSYKADYRVCYILMLHFRGTTFHLLRHISFFKKVQLTCTFCIYIFIKLHDLYQDSNFRPNINVNFSPMGESIPKILAYLGFWLVQESGTVFSKYGPHLIGPHPTCIYTFLCM